MYKKVLCAVEASKESEQVLAKAVQLSTLLNSQLLLIHVMPYSLLPKDYQNELENNVSKKIEKMAEKYAIPKKNQIIKIGKPYEQICVQAEKKHADLIIIGTHSKKGIKSLIGSTANAVLNFAKCDVSLIKI